MMNFPWLTIFFWNLLTEKSKVLQTLQNLVRNLGVDINAFGIHFNWQQNDQDDSVTNVLDITIITIQGVRKSKEVSLTEIIIAIGACYKMLAFSQDLCHASRSTEHLLKFYY